MKLTDIQHLKDLSFRELPEEIDVDAKLLLELRTVLEWAQEAYKALVHISTVSEWNAAPLLGKAPDEVKHGD